MIRINDLRKVYRTDEVETVALDNMSLHIKEHEFVAIMGPSGCGKSTLLNILGLLDDPTSGSYLLNGIEVTGFNENKRCDLRRENIGFVFQNFNLIEELTVFENIELPLENSGMKASLRKMKVEKALKSVLLSHRRNYFPSQLSGGQQQRVAIARAIVNDPKLILADEPTGNLDTASSIEIMELFRQLHKEGATVVVVTHEEDIAAFADRVIRFSDGQVQSDTLNTHHPGEGPVDGMEDILEEEAEDAD